MKSNGALRYTNSILHETDAAPRAVHESDVYDVIGVGFGPAGIALAAAMEDAEEADRRPAWRSLFIERAADSTWQPNMLMRGTDIQHHYLRDFATPRDPRSRFTFPNYLKESGRLFRFGLLGGNPGRVEWSDYVGWVARQLAHRALYGHDVTSVEPIVDAESGEVRTLRVNAARTVDGAMRSFEARNVVLCIGRRPSVPAAFRAHLGPAVFHSHWFRSRIGALTAEPGAVAVVGSGQNAIEVLLDLADRFPTAALYSINRNSGFRLYDLGHFSNEVYFPDEAEYFFSLPKRSRDKLAADVRFTNYSSVDADVSRTLYWRVYEEEIQGTRRIHVLKRSEVTEVEPAGGAFTLHLGDMYRHDRSTVRADVVVLCTGFVEDQIPDCIVPLTPFLDLDADGDVVISRDYEIRTEPGFEAGLFINGLTERTHGISDSASFSMMALKAQRTLDRLHGRRAADLVSSAGGELVRR